MSGDIAVDDITFTPECQIYTGGDFPVVGTTSAPMSKYLAPSPRKNVPNYKKEISHSHPPLYSWINLVSRSV